MFQIKSICTRQIELQGGLLQVVALGLVVLE